MAWKDVAAKLDEAIDDAKTCKQLYQDAQSLVEKLKSEALEALKAGSESIIEEHYGPVMNGHTPKRRRRRTAVRRRKRVLDRSGRKQSVLKLFGEKGGFLTTGEVITRFGWPSSTSTSVLNSLVADGKVSRTNKGRFSLDSVRGKKEEAKKTS